MKSWAYALKVSARAAARDAVLEAAENLASRAAGLTPVRTGRLRAGWRVGREPGPDMDPDSRKTPEGGCGTDAPVMYVVNFTPYALAVELGTLGRPGRHMALRAAELGQGELRNNFLSVMGDGANTTRSDRFDFESLGQSLEPEEIIGDPLGIDSRGERSGR